MTISLNLSMVGKKFTFMSKNPNDKVVYRGTLVTFTVLSETGRYGNGNVVAYNQAVRQADSSVPSDATDLSLFFVIKLDNSNGSVVEYVMAPEWVVDGSFKLLDTSVTVSLEVQDAAGSDHSGIIEALRSAGYINSRIVSTTS